MVELSGRARNNFFLIFLSVTVVSILFAGLVALDQNNKTRAENQKFVDAKKLITTDKSADAEPVFVELLDKYPNSIDIMWNYGICLAVNGKYEKSLMYMDLAQKTFPGITTMPSYLVGYGQILYETGDLDNAKYYFEQCIKHKNEEKGNYSQVAEQYLEKISMKKSQQ